MIHARNKGGMTLLELLASIAVFTVLINTGVQVYIGAMRLSDAGTHAMECIGDLDDVRDEFYRFTRESTGIADAAGGFARSESLMLWELGADRVAVLGSPHENAAPVSIILERRGDAWATVYLKRFPTTIEAVRFDTPGDRTIRMIVTLNNLGMENTVPLENAFTATQRTHGEPAEVVAMSDAL